MDEQLQSLSRRAQALIELEQEIYCRYFNVDIVQPSQQHAIIQLEKIFGSPIRNNPSNVDYSSVNVKSAILKIQQLMGGEQRGDTIPIHTHSILLDRPIMNVKKRSVNLNC